MNICKYFFVPALLLFIPAALPPWSAKPPLKYFYFSGLAQGTSYHITYYARSRSVSQQEVDSILDKIDSSLSIYKPYSLISRFNRSADGVVMDEHLSRIIHKSLKIYKETGGVSDISIYPLMRLWGFGPDPIAAAQPDSAAISAVMPCVGSDKIHIRGNRLVKDLPCLKIDVNGIGQGYSVDLVADFLEKKGIRNYLVEIGGEIRVRGRAQPGGTLMEIGIEAPARNSSDAPVIKKIIRLGRGAVTTSGNYRKYYVKKGRIIAHLMDPKTGYPFQNEMISVTVVARDGITADGYDNALMGMGLKKALLFLKKHRGMDAYFIYRNADGTISDTATAGFYKIPSVINPPPATD